MLPSNHVVVRKLQDFRQREIRESKRIKVRNSFMITYSVACILTMVIKRVKKDDIQTFLVLSGIVTAD